MRATHAGVVAFRSARGQTLYLVAESSEGSAWILPKGHIEQGEDAETAALRELEEETGGIGEVVGHLLRQRFEKAEESVVVDYYLVRWIGSTRASESRAIRWEEGETALQLLTFDDSKEVMERAIALTEV